MNRRNFASLVISPALVGCLGSREPDGAGEIAESHETAEIDDSRQPSSATVGALTVSIGHALVTGAIGYYDADAQAIATVKPTRDWWAIPRITVENIGVDAIDYPEIDDFRVIVGNDHFEAVGGIDGIDETAIRQDASGDDLLMPSFPGRYADKRLGADTRRWMRPLFDIGDGDSIAVEWIPGDTMLVPEEADVVE